MVYDALSNKFITINSRKLLIVFLPSPYLLVCSFCDLFFILNDGNIYSILHSNVDAEIS